MAEIALVVGGMQSRVAIMQTALERVGWQVVSFLNPKEAMDSLQATRYHALFCDEQLRGASPAGLLVWTRRALPELPFYLFSNSLDANRFRSSGEPTALLHFPPVLAQLPIPADTPPPDLRASAPDLPLSGSTGLLPLSDLIEMMGLAGQSGVIELGGGRSGLVVLHKGRLEHALALAGETPRSGIGALAQLIKLPETDFHVTPYRVPERATLNLSTSAALTEAARLADEELRFGVLLHAVMTKCPQASAVVVGQPLPGAPLQGLGDAKRLSALALKLLEVNRAALGRSLGEALFVTEGEAVVLGTFGEGRVLAASAPERAKGALYRAVQAALAEPG